MDNYFLRLRPEAARKLLDALRIRLNSPVRHRGKLHSWDTVIRLKAQELANYIQHRRAELSFDEPNPTLERTDSEALRKFILSITSAEARKLGIRKNTLWYLQQRARSYRPFSIYPKIMAKLPQLDS
jgi:hypothetical protein